MELRGMVSVTGFLLLCLLAMVSSVPLTKQRRIHDITGSSPKEELFPRIVKELSLVMDAKPPALQPLPWKHLDKPPFTPPPIAETLPPYRGCYYNGKWHHSGTEISRGYDPSSNWCWFVHCENGHIIHGDDFHCHKTTTAPPAPPPAPGPPAPFIPPERLTTVGPTEEPEEEEPETKYDYKCEDDGHEYTYGQEIYHHQEGNFCYGEYCGEWGELIPWENWDCGSLKESSARLHQNIAGCYVDGKHYGPGQDIEKGHDGDWCYGKYCSTESEVIDYHNTHCMHGNGARIRE